VTRLPTTLFGAASSSSEVTIAKYVAVGYATLKRRSKQLYEYKGEWPWEFVAALATVESGMSYSAVNKSTGAAGLFAIMKSTAIFLRISYDDMKKSVPLQLRAGKKLLADYRTRISSAAPEVLSRGGTDLYAVAYLYHNLGIGAAPNVIKKARAAGKDITWANLQGYVSSGLVEVINRLVALAPLYQGRYAELVEDQKTQVASQSFSGAGDTSTEDLSSEMLQNAEEGDGDTVAIPSSLDDYGPDPLPDGSTLQEQVSASSTWLWVLGGLVAVTALGVGTYVLVSRSRADRAAGGGRRKASA